MTGATAALFGWFMMEVMTTVNIAPLEGKSALDESEKWIIIMVLASVLLFITKSGVGWCLSEVAENIIKHVRMDLYEKIVRKDIGWHDQRDNASGVMTATLASDVQLLNGVSSEGMAVQVEALGAVLCAVIAGFVFSWPMTLVGLGIIPFIIICGAM